MAITLGLNLTPFSVPDYVYLQLPSTGRPEGFQESPKIQLSKLTPEVLDELCNQFRADAFNKAGFTDPKGV